jgi:hypothetical protein
MKIRQGFVSNSSSSSFVIIGEPIDFSEVEKYDNVWFVGQSYDEGLETFPIDQEFKNKYREREFHDCQFFNTIKAVDDFESKFSLDEIKKLNDKCIVFAFDADNNNNYQQGNFQDFEKDYVD